jgi:hypothetical protein
MQKQTSSGISISVGDMVFIPVVNSENLRELRQELKQSMAEFGWTLKRALDPVAQYPFTRQYIDRLEKGKDRITEEIQAAYFIITGVMDGKPAGVEGTSPTPVMALPNQIMQGAYLPPEYISVRCGLPGCQVHFIKPKWSNRLYHHPDCKKRMRAIRRKPEQP